MKNEVKCNPFLRIFLLLTVLLLTGIAAAVGLFYYVFAIPEPEGLSLASWPSTFTDNFSAWLDAEEGTIKIEDTGIKRLDEYGLWIQILDKSGQEVFSHNKPADSPANYSISELIALSTGAYEQDNAIFLSHFEDSGKTWNYMIGFPYSIGKYTLYYNGENVGRLYPVFRIVIGLSLCLIIFFILTYGFVLTRHLGKIAEGIDNVSLCTYNPLPEKGIFGGIYRKLNKTALALAHSDKIQKDTERARREWIVNITHDLKTPLSPVKGYAELLSDGPVPDGETVQEYGKIILKNVNLAEKLMNDLKLTYQLDSGAIPYSPQKVRLTRYLKELVIDIINDPAFRGCNIEFGSDAPGAVVLLDPDLFRRAVGNIMINALTHNPPDTKVTVSVHSNSQKGISIVIGDNGAGLSDAEQSELFNRYYRGTNTKEKPEGSGLGLAIAKQIVTLHGGDITVKSKLGEGTQFTISLPLRER